MTLEDPPRLRAEAEAKVAEAARLERLSARFPDLRKHVGRWNKVAYCSKSVNAAVQEVDLRHNCGCCNDSPLEAWPFVQTEDGPVHSDPPCFFVGEKHWIAGDRPSAGWREKMREAGIPEAVSALIQARFDADRELRVRVAKEDGEEPAEEDGG